MTLSTTVKRGATIAPLAPPEEPSAVDMRQIGPRAAPGVFMLDGRTGAGAWHRWRA